MKTCSSYETDIMYHHSLLEVVDHFRRTMNETSFSIIYELGILSGHDLSDQGPLDCHNQHSPLSCIWPKDYGK